MQHQWKYTITSMFYYFIILCIDLCLIIWCRFFCVKVGYSPSWGKKCIYCINEWKSSTVFYSVRIFSNFLLVYFLFLHKLLLCFDCFRWKVEAERILSLFMQKCVSCDLCLTHCGLHLLKCDRGHHNSK